MGGVDTRDRYHVHWGPPEQYAERREESALRRSGRPVPDRTFDAFEPIDLRAARRHPGRRGPPAASRRRASSSRHRRPTATCPWPRSSTSPTRPAPGTASSTASPPPTRTCASSRRAATSCGSAAARSARCWAAGACWLPSASISARTSAASAPMAPCASRRPTATAPRRQPARRGGRRGPAALQRRGRGHHRGRALRARSQPGTAGMSLPVLPGARDWPSVLAGASGAGRWAEAPRGGRGGRCLAGLPQTPWRA